MAGTTIQAVKRLKMTFDAGFFGTTAGKVMTMPLALNIPAPFTQGSVNVRVHAITLPANNPTFKVSVRNVAPTSEDPTGDYWGSELAFASITSATAAGALVEGNKTWTSADKPAGMVGIFLVVDTGTASSAITLVLSVELSLKS